MSNGEFSHHPVVSHDEDGAKGKHTLAELFDGRSQLVVYHFMYAPGAKAGCPHCSLRADGFDGIQPHLNQRDVTMVCVSRAPYDTLAAYQRMQTATYTTRTRATTAATTT